MRFWYFFHMQSWHCKSASIDFAVFLLGYDWYDWICVTALFSKIFVYWKNQIWLRIGEKMPFHVVFENDGIFWTIGDNRTTEW